MPGEQLHRMYASQRGIRRCCSIADPIGDVDADTAALHERPASRARRCGSGPRQMLTHGHNAATHPPPPIPRFVESSKATDRRASPGARIHRSATFTDTAPTNGMRFPRPTRPPHANHDYLRTLANWMLRYNCQGSTQAHTGHSTNRCRH
ncbi:hypothetical protein GCM10018952_64840 [Streptosporangium vulgare]